MKSQLFKMFMMCLCLSFSFTALAQADFQGKAYYESKTTAEMPDFGGRQMSEEQKKRIEARMKSMLEKTYILSFNRSESIYKEEEKLDAPSSSGGRGFRGMDLTPGPQYKNIKTNQVIVDQEFFGKQFLIKDSLPKLVWKMENESKQIGQYTCFKATAVKLDDQTDITSFRGPRRPEDEKADDTPKEPKEITITAWYTPQIPVNQGPGDYWGLPGLILEVNTDRTTILCSKIILNATEDTEIKVPTKGKEVTQEEYTKIVTKKMAELRENFSGRGPGGGGRR
ncbi:GLPGLI family protein [Formosa sediminum]|uniref:GLPGLI family protein n=1 Tax=Formosa sediminum TaxID=2594004 RepID=A0A516GMW6_9FLAO|nr:GLPGLI family protein [Formosa sediminum]QDO92872.1 GLPGLI family protein [Formosa sediminum]